MIHEAVMTYAHLSSIKTRRRIRFRDSLICHFSRCMKPINEGDAVVITECGGKSKTNYYHKKCYWGMWG